MRQFCDVNPKALITNTCKKVGQLMIIFTMRLCSALQCGPTPRRKSSPSFNKRRTSLTLLQGDTVMAFKWMTNQAPNFLNDQFITRVNVTGHNTWNFQLLNTPLYKSKAGQRTFHYRIVDICNNLDPTLKTLQSLAFFQYLLKSE